jgi:hypothetical protein
MMMINIGECMNFHAGIGNCCERRGIINSLTRQQFQGFLLNGNLVSFTQKPLKILLI